MALPNNLNNCLTQWYHSLHGAPPPVNAWEITKDALGLRITAWILADTQPDEATINTFAATADAYVRSNVEGDTERWSKEMRLILKLIFTLWKVVVPSLTAQQFKVQVKNLWDNL